MSSIAFTSSSAASSDLLFSASSSRRFAYLSYACPSTVSSAKGDEIAAYKHVTASADNHTGSSFGLPRPTVSSRCSFLLYLKGVEISIRGTDTSSSHGIPEDRKQRLVIIRTQMYNPSKMMQVIAVRAQVEGLTMDEECLVQLGEIAQRTSLRHAVQLPSFARLEAKNNGRDNICQADIEEVASLFVHAIIQQRCRVSNKKNTSHE